MNECEGATSLDLDERIRRRNERNHDPFVSLVNSYRHVFAQSHRFEAQLVEIKADARARASDSEQVAVLRQRLADLQGELSVKHKGEAVRAQSNLMRVEKHRQVEILLDQTQNEVARLKRALEAAEAKREEAESETSLLREEMTRARTRSERLESRIKELVDENRSLIERTIADKQRLVEEMNQLTELYQEAGARERASRRRVSETVFSTPDSEDALETALTNASSTEGREAGEFDVAALSKLRFDVDVVSVRFETGAHDTEVSAARFQRDDPSTLATSSSDGTVCIWTLGAGSNSTLSAKKRTTLRASSGFGASPLMCVDVGETLVLSGGSDRSARIWSRATDRVAHTLTGHSGKNLACRFSSAETGAMPKFAVTGSTDRTLITWDVNTGYKTRAMSCASMCNALDVDANDSLIVSGHQDRSLRLFDVRSGKSAGGSSELHAGAVTCARFMPDGTSILSASRDNTLCIVDARMSQEALKRFRHPDLRIPFNWSAAAAHPSGSHIACGGHSGSVFVWSTTDPSKDARVWSADVHDQIALEGLDWSESVLAATDRQGNLSLWA